ncbi:MAG: DUF58 domain-containing protein, partial [Bacteroidia bacterium]
MYQLKQEDLLQIPNLEFLANQVVEGFITGMHKSPYHGFSVEFAEHRQYNTGESTRHIDWKLLGRTDKLFVKRYEEETNLRCQLVIDASASMYYPEKGLNKLRFSVIAAASIIQLLKKQRDATGLSIFGDGLSFNSPAKSSSIHQKRLFFEMEQLLNQKTGASGSKISENLHLLADSLHKRSLVIVFTDLFQSGDSDLKQALQHLKFNKHEVILFHVGDKETELQFEFKNMPHVFIDSETGEKLKIHPQAIQQEYLEYFEKFKQDLKVSCLQYKIELIEAFIGNDFNQILFPFLMKRAKL